MYNIHPLKQNTMYKKLFLVALHVKDYYQAIREAAKMLTPNGAHGVILVNNGLKISSKKSEYPSLFDTAMELKSKVGDKYLVGINPLDLRTAKEAIEILYETVDQYGIWPDVLWTDTHPIVEKSSRVYIPESILFDIKGMETAYYGSISFKGQPEPHDLETVALLGSRNFHTVVTSGPGTGQPADVEKIKKMSEIVGSDKLALASGVTTENLYQYFEYVNTFIVGTSLQQSADDPFVYSSERVKEFHKKFDELCSVQ